MTTGIGCISGGLDSQLAVALLQKQGVEVIALHVQHLWHPGLTEEGAKPPGVRAVEARGVPVRVVNAARADLDLVQHPAHGFGKHLNPCIDCRIWTLREARRLMQEEGANFVFTGEVLGQRPMSQHRGALNLVAREAGLEDLVLRPLSAKRLPPTKPEREGKVNRDLLMGFSGRTRKPQMALAAELGLTDYPTPAGGCLLTDPGFAFRLRELMDHMPPTAADVELLKVGRHFRLADGSRLVLGRHHEDNLLLERLFQTGDVRLEADRMPGPLGLLRGEATEENLALAAGLVLRYGKAKAGETHPVRVERISGEKRTLEARTADNDLAQRLIIRPKEEA